MTALLVVGIVSWTGVIAFAILALTEVGDHRALNILRLATLMFVIRGRPLWARESDLDEFSPSGLRYLAAGRVCSLVAIVCILLWLISR